MTNILHVDSSILGSNSVSRKISAAIVERLSTGTPAPEIVYRDLVANPLPHQTLAHLSPDHPIAVSMGAPSALEAESERVQSRTVLDEFLTANIVVVGAAMYNFTVPSQLKTWIDRLVVPGKTFRYSETGAEGLAGGKRIIVAGARGNIYLPGAPAAGFEHLETYLRAIFGFLGVTQLEFIIADGVALGPDHHAKAVQGALESASALSVV